MRAISLTEPYASLIAVGAKRIETRSWMSRYRGPLAIHAAKSVDEASVEVFAGFASMEKYRIDWDNLPSGAIVAVVELLDCERITRENAPPIPELVFGDYDPGRWAWKLGEPRRLVEPVPCRGALGLWTPPPEVRREIERRLAA